MWCGSSLACATGLNDNDIKNWMGYSIILAQDTDGEIIVLSGSDWCIIHFYCYFKNVIITFIYY